MFARSRSLSPNSEESIIAHLKEFYDKYWDEKGDRKRNEADTLLVIRDERPPEIPLDKLNKLLKKYTREKSNSKIISYIFRYGERHYPEDDFGITGSNTTKMLKPIGSASRRRYKGGKRRYKRKTYKNKNPNK
jgi:hypothetical protein